jgi:hypothetical protein
VLGGAQHGPAHLPAFSDFAGGTLGKIAVTVA